MKRKIPVSVIIATYNSKESLERVLESLCAQDFDFSKFEVIIVDDCSGDGTVEMLKEWKKEREDVNVKLLIMKERGGPAAARNAGVERARGEIVAFTDADCLVPGNWLRKILGAYEKNSEVVGVGGYLEPNSRNFVAKIERAKNRFLHRIPKEEKVGGTELPIGFTNNMSYKKKIFLEFGGFDERFGKPAGEDFDLKQRICKEGHKVAFVPIAVVHNESYDLDYLLRQILKRGSEKRFRESKGAMIAELFLNFPFIMLNLFRKFLKYRRDYKR